MPATAYNTTYQRHRRRALRGNPESVAWLMDRQPGSRPRTALEAALDDPEVYWHGIRAYDADYARKRRAARKAPEWKENVCTL